jgi:hypothetical protein
MGLGVAIAATRNAQAAPPAKGGAPPMSIQPTAAPVDVAAPAEKPKPSPNSVFAEGLGAGLLYSFNYERMVIDDLGVRAGFSYLSMGASAGGQSASASFLMVPVTANYIGVRAGKHALELGGGATLISASGAASGFGTNTSSSGLTAVGTMLVGYRIHPIEGAGFQFRVGMMGLMGKGMGLSVTDPSAFGVLPWPYLSLGASF